MFVRAMPSANIEHMAVAVK